MTCCNRAFLTCGLMVAGVSMASAAELYVNGASPAAEAGTKSNPFRTVQAAINAAAATDTIRVAVGAYTENLRIDGKALTLEGGYSATWERDPGKFATTLKGAGGNAVINIIGADATIDGFRITGGTGSTEEQPYGFHGGGIYSRDGSPTISNNIVEDNDLRRSNEASDYNFGGGIHVTNAPSAKIVNNVVRRNFAGRGGGISVLGQAALIQGNTVEDNTAIGDHGGGMFLAIVRGTITQNVIRRNEVGRDLSYGWGGGLIFYGAGNFAELSFNTLSENFAAAYGAAEFIDEGAKANLHHELIYGNRSKVGCEAVSAIAVDGGDQGGSEVSIAHCTVVGNVCESAIRGNGLQVEGNSVARVTNSIFWNNGGDDFATDGTSSLVVTYTNSQERIAGVGNISADPRFRNEPGADFCLASGSPCIDAADPASPFDKETTDSGRRADMGRFGNAPESGAPTTGGGIGGVTPSTTTTDAPTTTEQPAGTTADAADAGRATDVATTGLCPASAAALLSISFISARSAQRRQRR